jgi:hypothetical protein
MALFPDGANENSNSGSDSPDWLMSLIGQSGSIFNGIANIAGATNGKPINNTPYYGGASDKPSVSEDNTLYYIIGGFILLIALLFYFKSS